ncbi:MAG: helix-turn-helix domain-containing protein [Spirochaetota bacterium]
MDNEGRYTIDELVDLTGLQRRTIRFYVEKGLLEPPAGRGRGGFYDAEHLARLREIVQAREEGRSLASIRGRSSEKDLAGEAAGPSIRRTLTWELAQGLRLEVDESAFAGRRGLVEAILALAALHAEK